MVTIHVKKLGIHVNLYIMKDNKSNLKDSILALILIAGIIIGVYLTQKTQIFKPRASSGMNEILEVTDENGKAVPFKNGTYQLKNPQININLKTLSQ